MAKKISKRLYWYYGISLRGWTIRNPDGTLDGDCFEIVFMDRSNMYRCTFMSGRKRTVLGEFKSEQAAQRAARAAYVAGFWVPEVRKSTLPRKRKALRGTLVGRRFGKSVSRGPGGGRFGSKNYKEG